MGMSPNVIVRVHYYENGSEGRDFYSSAKKDDYVNYVDKGIRQTQKPGDYLSYADNPEKSSGVFNANGQISTEGKKELRKMLRPTDSTIWDCVISFEEEYGKRNCDTQEEARKLLTKVLPPFFKSIGLNPEKTVWYAGLHQNTDNRHIHLSFFQAEPNFYDRKTKGMKYRRGKIPLIKIDALKASIERHYLSPIQGVERVRKMAVEESRKAVSGQYSEELGAIGRLCRKLAEEIPEEGSLAYSSENMARFRDDVDAISALVMETNGLWEPYRKVLKKAENRDREMRLLCQKDKIDPKPYMYAPKFRADMKRRMGNAIIKEIVAKRNASEEIAKRLKHPKAIQRVRQKTAMSYLSDATYFAQKAAQVGYEVYIRQKENEEAWERAEEEVRREKGETESEA